MLKQQVRQHAPDLKQKLVDEFSELTHKTWKWRGTILTRSLIGFRRRPGSHASKSSSVSVTTRRI
jgi:hypothetical protein